MTRFKISPLKQEKPTAKRRSPAWLWLIIAIETLAAGYWGFRLNERITPLEQQLLEQTNGEKADVFE